MSSSRISETEKRTPQGAGRQGFLARRPHLVPAAIAATMLCLAMGKWPYGYYAFMRWVVCVVAVLVAYRSWKWRRPWGIWVFDAAAVLFNLLVPVHTKRRGGGTENCTTLEWLGNPAFGFALVRLSGTHAPFCRTFPPPGFEPVGSRGNTM